MTTARVVTGKARARADLLSGAYGNRLRTWGSVVELEASGYTGFVSLRYAGAGGGGAFAYAVPALRVPLTIEEFVRTGCIRDRFILCETPPDDLLLLQGEAMRTPLGWELAYSTTPGISLREAMARPSRATGMRALAMLQTYLSPSSYDDLREIWAARPDAVIEFSAYAVPVGDCRGRNAVVWEVREDY